MGSIYRPTYKDRQGIERESAIWWIQYYSHGRKIRESADTADYGEAKEYLKKQEGEAVKCRRVSMSVERKALFSELAQLVEDDYQLNGRSTVFIELLNGLHVLPYFGKMKAVRITEPDVDRYILHRKDEGASNASINRELCAIRRAYSLGIQKRIDG